MNLTDAQIIKAKEQFATKTKKLENGCVVWLGGQHQKRGYIVLGKTLSTHRVSYYVFKGPIAPGLVVCHSCDNSICMNPDHLFLGTQGDNVRDAVRKGRYKTPGNIYKS